MKKVKLYFKYKIDDNEKGSVAEFDAVQAKRLIGRGALIADEKAKPTQKKVEAQKVVAEESRGAYNRPGHLQEGQQLPDCV